MQIGWGKFYPKKVINIWGVELSTEISHVKHFIQKSYPKKISKDLSYSMFFLNVGLPKESIFLTIFYGLYFSHQYTNITNYIYSCYFHWKILALAGIWTRDLPGTNYLSWLGCLIQCYFIHKKVVYVTWSVGKFFI